MLACASYFQRENIQGRDQACFLPLFEVIIGVLMVFVSVKCMLVLRNR